MQFAPLAPENDRAWIYAFTDSITGKILYVGQTGNPSSRKVMHLNHGLHKAELNKPNVIYRMLRETNGADVSRIEVQVIAALRRRGECRLNRNKGGSGRMKSDDRIACSNGLIFSSKSQAGRYFDVSPATIYNWLTHWNGEVPYREKRKKLRLWELDILRLRQ